MLKNLKINYKIEQDFVNYKMKYVMLGDSTT